MGMEHAPLNGHGNVPDDWDEEFFVETDLDDNALAWLDTLVGKRVVSLALWVDPIVEAIAAQLEEDLGDLGEGVVDVELYFEDNLVLELYSVLVYPDETAPPLTDKNRIARLLERYVERGIHLAEVAEEEETGAPIFIFEQPDTRETFLLVADGWIVDEWDQLPEEE